MSGREAVNLLAQAYCGVESCASVGSKITEHRKRERKVGRNARLNRAYDSPVDISMSLDVEPSSPP
jgi:hypothetical protein